MTDKLQQAVDTGAGQKLWAEVDDDGSVSVYYSTVGDERGLVSWNFFPSGTVVVNSTKLGTLANIKSK